jgi:hypothetical protein
MFGGAMPALPWVKREAIDPSGTYVVMASLLPLQHHRSVPGFLRDVLVIRRQLALADGLVGYGLDAELTKKTFWTFSIWRTREHLDSFARSDPHNRIIGALRPLMGDSRFEFLSIAGDKIPRTWQERKALLR